MRAVEVFVMLVYNAPVAANISVALDIGLLSLPSGRHIQIGKVKWERWMQGFIKLNRTPDLPKLILKDHHSFCLLSLIAYRTIREKDRFDDLEPGQAYVGDWQVMGFPTRYSYRKALRNLSKWGFISFKTSRKGTITTLLDSTIYDINSANLASIAPTDDQQNANNAPLLKNVKNDKNEKNGKEVIAVFDHWVAVMDKPRAKLTKERKTKVIARLKDYSVDDLKQAIDGCARSPHHMGQNDTGTVYDDLELICRDGKHVEQFRDNIGKAIPQDVNSRNLQAARDFLDG